MHKTAQSLSYWGLITLLCHSNLFTLERVHQILQELDMKKPFFSFVLFFCVLICCFFSTLLSKVFFSKENHKWGNFILSQEKSKFCVKIWGILLLTSHKAYKSFFDGNSDVILNNIKGIGFCGLITGFFFLPKDLSWMICENWFVVGEKFGNPDLGVTAMDSSHSKYKLLNCEIN